MSIYQYIYIYIYIYVNTHTHTYIHIYSSKPFIFMCMEFYIKKTFPSLQIFSSRLGSFFCPGIRKYIFHI